MLKAFAVEDIRPGMRLGRDATDPMGEVVVRRGATLDQSMIPLLRKRGIVTVLITFPDPPSDIAPKKEVLIDKAYASSYDDIYTTLSSLLNDLCWRSILDMGALKSILAADLFQEAPDDARAISQIHNASQKGDPLIHQALSAAILAKLMTHWLGFNERERHDLITAALLYSVGKLNLPKSILEKKTRLTFAEENIVKEYPKFSYSALKDSPLSASPDILRGILGHRELLDGSGFPNKLKGAAIVPIARILGIIDLYIALATKADADDRKSPFEIFAILEDGIYQGRYDATYAVPFMRHVCHALYGNWVRLTDGTAARIVYLDESRVTALPIVQRLDGTFVNLATTSDIRIERILTAEELDDFAG